MHLCVVFLRLLEQQLTPNKKGFRLISCANCAGIASVPHSPRLTLPLHVDIRSGALEISDTHWVVFDF